MSDLRDEIARAIHDYACGCEKQWPVSADYEQMADAVLRVVGERLLSDEAVEAVAMTYEPDSFVGNAPHADESLRDARDVLSAAWRVATGSNHE